MSPILCRFLWPRRLRSSTLAGRLPTGLRAAPRRRAVRRSARPLAGCRCEAATRQTAAARRPLWTARWAPRRSTAARPRRMAPDPGRRCMAGPSCGESTWSKKTPRPTHTEASSSRCGCISATRSGLAAIREPLARGSGAVEHALQRPPSQTSFAGVRPKDRGDAVPATRAERGEERLGAREAPLRQHTTARRRPPSRKQTEPGCSEAHAAERLKRSASPRRCPLFL